MRRGMRKRKLPISNVGRLAQLTTKKAFDILHVRNGRELATMLYERIAGVKLTMDFSPTVRMSVAYSLLCIFSLSLYHEQSEMRRGRELRVERIEIIRRAE